MCGVYLTAQGSTRCHQSGHYVVYISVYIPGSSARTILNPGLAAKLSRASWKKNTAKTQPRHSTHVSSNSTHMLFIFQGSTSQLDMFPARGMSAHFGTTGLYNNNGMYVRDNLANLKQPDTVVFSRSTRETDIWSLALTVLKAAVRSSGCYVTVHCAYYLY